MPSSEKSVALLVLGMHRSGTSALTRVLNLLGAYLPPELLGSTAANETGHWEPSGMVSANMKAFAALDLEWHSVESFPDNWFESAGVTPAERTAAAFLDQSFGHQKLFVLKDPRTCRTLPMWLRRLSKYGAPPVAVLVLRNPLEVAASLKNRDGMTKQHSLLLWLRHSLEAELHSRGVPRIITTYEDVLGNWERVTAAIAEVGDFAWPANLHRAREEIDAFLSREHRHHQLSDDLARPEVMIAVRRTHSALLDLRDEDKREAALAELDDIRRELESADAVFGGVLSDFEVATRDAKRRARDVEQALSAEAELRASLEAEVRRGDARHAALTAELTRLSNEAVATRDEMLSLEGASERLAAQLSDAKTVLEQSADAIRRVEAERDEIAAERDRIAADRADLGSKRADLELRLNAASAEVARSADGLSVERTSRERAENAKKATDAKLAETQSVLAKASAERDSASARAQVEAQVTAQAKAQALVQNAITRTVLPQAREDAAAIARAKVRERVRRRQGGLRFGRPARVLRCALFGLADFVAQPSRLLALLSKPRSSALLARDRYLLRRTGLFDRGYYLSAYPDIAAAGVDALDHYLAVGWREGRQPSEDVKPLERSSVDAVDEHPLRSVLHAGAHLEQAALSYAEGLAEAHAQEALDRAVIEASGLFNAEFYVANNALAAPPMPDPLTHYMRNGWRQGYAVGPDFDAAWYVTNYADVAEAALNPLLHYIVHGAAEGRRAQRAPQRPMPPSPVAAPQGASPAPSAAPPALAPPVDDLRMACVPGDRAHIEGAKTVVLCAHVAGKTLFGGERSFLDMAEGLNACGFNVVITSPHGNGAYIAELRKHATFVRLFSYGWWRDGRPIDPSVINAFSKVFIEAEADAVHVNTIMLREPLLAARRLGLRSIVHVREFITEDPTLLGVMRETAEDVIAQVREAADVIAANSASTAELFAKPGATYVVPNVVDFDALAMPNLVNAEAVTFALIGSNLAKKGIGDVFRLAEMCEERVPNARFQIIGPDTPDLAALRDAYAERIPTNLTFIDYQASPRDALARADVVLNFSHFAESFGRTVLEGFAARRPSIAYRKGALPELITHGENGFLVEFGDLEAALGHVAELCANPQLIMTLGESGRRTASERYSKQAYKAAMARLYEAAFAPARAPLETPPARRGEDARLFDSVIHRARDISPPKPAEWKPRIAYFAWHFPVPSETFILNELRLLVAEGHDVRVYCRQVPHPNFKPDFPITWERVTTPEELAAKLKESSRDIAHGHFTYPTVTDFLWPACEAAGIEFTFTAHAQDIFRYGNDEKNRIGEIGRSKACRRIFILSRFHYDYLVERGVPREKIVINGNGIDPRAFEGGIVAGRASRSFRRVCAVHRFAPKKGLEHLLRAGKLLEKDGIAIDLYGYGDLDKAYRAIIEAENITNVSLLGPVETREGLVDVLKRYDLFACPSVRAPDGDMDGIPTVLMEAMAAGMPVLATQIAGIPDLVQDGVTGLVCEGDPQSIAAAIRRFYAMPAARVDALIANGRAHVEDRYNIHRLVNVLKRVWRNDTIDLVIVSKDNTNELTEIIRRLYAMTSLPFHLVVCDNESGAETSALLERLHAEKGNFTLIKNGYNAMVGPGTNRAMESCWSDCIIYVCGKEGFALSPGWEIPFVHRLDADARAGMVGTLGHSPTYLRGQDYPKGVSLFANFRNQDFAARNPDRVFKHIQGGLFAIRRAMVDEIGGFSQAVPHSLTDVEYSYYAESCGWKLTEANHILALYNKTRPGIEAHFDERVSAIHPPQLGDLAWLDEVVSGKSVCCNVCGWRGPRFGGADGAEACPSCASLPEDRTFYRWLARSTLPHRRLPALGVNVPASLEPIWRVHFQGPTLTGDALTERLRSRGRLDNAAGGLQFAFIRSVGQAADLAQMLKEANRLLADGGTLTIQLCGERDEVLTRAEAEGFTLVEDPLYRSTAARYDWRRLYVLSKGAGVMQQRGAH